MAATTLSDLQLITAVANGYLPMFLTESFSLLSTGAVQYEEGNPQIKGEGNIFQMRHLNPDTNTLQTPSANTNLDVRSIGTDSINVVAKQRGDSLGLEDLSALIGGLSIDQAGAEIARLIGHKIINDMEVTMLQKVIPGVCASTLAATNVIDKSSMSFDYAFLNLAQKLVGERSGLLRKMIIHPNVYWNANMNLQLTMTPMPDMVEKYMALGAGEYVGKIGLMDVWLNERVYSTGVGDGAVYDTVISSPGAFYIGVRESYPVELERLPRLAAGTTNWSFKISYCPAVKHVSYTGAAPTDIGGVADADLLTGSNWTRRAGYSAKENPFFVIRSQA